MLPDSDGGSSAPGLLDIFLWAGAAIAGIVITAYRGYNSTPKRQEQFSVAGAIIDNSALQPLLAALTTLTEAIIKNSELREEEREEQVQQRQEERFERAVDQAVSRAVQMMRDNPAASMPGRRADPAE